jgi:hypothetical protein
MHGTGDELLVDYDDAARAIRRWFAQTLELGARHCACRLRRPPSLARDYPFSVERDIPFH